VTIPPPPGRDRSPPMLNAPPATLALVLALVAGWALTSLIGWQDGPAGALVFDAQALRTWVTTGAGAPAAILLALVGHAFVHAGLGHLAANALFLLAFATPVERALGARTMVAIFFAATAAGAIATALLAGTEPVLLIGASGGVHGVAGAAAMVLRRLGASQARRAGGGLLGFLVGVNLLIAALGGLSEAFGFRIGWEAHLGGLAAGVALARWRLRRLGR